MKSRGLTLLELVIALALVALVASLALPSFGSVAERARLKSTAETLASDFAEARYEAAKRGQSLHVELSPGPDWCWAVATHPTCPCGEAGPCRLKSERAADHGGITLVESHAARFDANGTADGVGFATFQAPHGERLRVEVAPLGRARICAPAGEVPGYQRC
jgi:type IV fimbrial biogenesis protein FimT